MELDNGKIRRILKSFYQKRQLASRMDNPLIHVVDDEDEEYPAIARLIELGRQKTYVTIDDILHFFPEAEQDVEQLEEAFAALISAGSPYVEDETPGEPTEDEL